MANLTFGFIFGIVLAAFIALPLDKATTTLQTCMPEGCTDTVYVIGNKGSCLRFAELIKDKTTATLVCK